VAGPIDLARIELATFSMSGIAPMQQFSAVGAISDAFSRHAEALRSARRGSNPFAAAHKLSAMFGNLRSGSSALACVEKYEFVPTIIDCWMKAIPVNLSRGTCHVFRDVSLTR